MPFFNLNPIYYPVKVDPPGHNVWPCLHLLMSCRHLTLSHQQIPMPRRARLCVAHRWVHVIKHLWKQNHSILIFSLQVSLTRNILYVNRNIETGWQGQMCSWTSLVSFTHPSMHLYINYGAPEFNYGALYLSSKMELRKQ